MAKLAKSVANGKIGVEGQARALLDIRKLELEMDKLNAKRAKIHIDTSALSKLSLPSRRRWGRLSRCPRR